jgi:hypothetical protein
MLDVKFLIKSVLLFGFCSAFAYASPSIAVLNFELNDITSLPNIPEEQRRTAGMAPILRKALAREFEVVEIAAIEQRKANAGFGYLYQFPDLVAQLGSKYKLDWIIVSQHSKPSFLESYILMKLINVKDPNLNRSFHLGLKGNHQRVTEQAIARLADKVSTYVMKK